MVPNQDDPSDRPPTGAGDTAPVPSGQTSNEKYRDLVEHTHDLIQSVDTEGRLVFVNAAWQQTFGWSSFEAQGKPLWEIIHEDSMEHCQLAFQQLMHEGGRVPINARFVSRTGQAIYVQGIAKVLRREDDVITHAFLRDVTKEFQEGQKRQSLEAELAQAQKMEALGRLTGGVAHDFNNLLTVIYANLDALEEHTDDEGRPFIEEIMHATDSGAELIARLLSLTRKGAHNPVPTDLREVSNRVEGLLRQTMPSSIHFTYEASPEPLIAILDPSQLEHALINLVMNAIDAVESDGLVTLRLRRYDNPNSEKPEGEFLEIEVQDDGCGMPPDVVKRAYEPFFTTKEIDKGSGIGLAQVYGCVNRADGHIQIQTEVGVGTTFQLLFPAASLD
jgi:PAS domain S-box-containing protein